MVITLLGRVLVVVAVFVVTFGFGHKIDCPAATEANSKRSIPDLLLSFILSVSINDFCLCSSIAFSFLILFFCCCDFLALKLLVVATIELMTCNLL